MSVLDAGWRLSHYEIVERLGEGGMGEVYRAVDARLGRDVAIKVVARGLEADAGARRRFEVEARAVAALNHPNIVTVYSVERATPRPPSAAGQEPLEGHREPSRDAVDFLTMELVEGVSLDAAIPEGGLRIERFFELALPLTAAVAAAHERGVVHRDLKPANILVTGGSMVTGADAPDAGVAEAGGDVAPRIKVLDFGIAKLRQEVKAASEAVTELTRTGTVVGTPAYMSPEQAAGEPVDSPSDVFSLGILLYEMLTGRRPFGGEDPVAARMEIINSEPESPSRARANLPAGLEEVVLRCLQKRPEDRFATGGEVYRELEARRRETGGEWAAASRPDSVASRPHSEERARVACRPTRSRPTGRRTARRPTGRCYRPRRPGTPRRGDGGDPRPAGGGLLGGDRPPRSAASGRSPA